MKSGPTHLSVLIVGRGRLGSSVARALRASGADVTHWPGRGRWPARVAPLDVVLLAVGDPFLEATAARLAERLDARVPVLHASGARGVTVMRALAPRPLGVFHPLVSFGSRRAGVTPGAAVVVAGAPTALARARALAARLGLALVRADVHGPRYHAAAALVANGSAALAAVAVDALVREGIARRSAERAVAGLLRSVADNVARAGLPAALTGPIVRGDAATVAAHRAALDAETLRAYDAVAPLVLDVARRAGLGRGPADAVRAAFKA